MVLKPVGNGRKWSETLERGHSARVASEAREPRPKEIVLAYCRSWHSSQAGCITLSNTPRRRGKRGIRMEYARNIRGFGGSPSKQQPATDRDASDLCTSVHPKRWSGKCSGNMRSMLASPASRRMTLAGPARSSAERLVESLSRFSCYWDTHPFKRLSDTSARSRLQPSTRHDVSR